MAAIIGAKDSSVTAQEVVGKAGEMFGDPNYLSASNLEQLTEAFIYENYNVHWPTNWGYIDDWVPGKPYHWIDPEGEQRIADQVTQWLSASRLVIAGVLASGSEGTVHPNSGVEHWVVITGISTKWRNDPWSEWNWVRIYNPFDNEIEYYPWNDFRKSWKADGNMLVLVRPNKLPIIDDCR
ncbi:hypothetical protein ACFLZW_03675 [Chloroflexota bacterium]